MQLIEIFLPLTDEGGKPFPAEYYEELRKEMTDRFGGVTAFNRAPAEGTFREGREIIEDEIVVFEVMAEELDRAWWNERRRSLERTFRQDEILIRASQVTKL